MPNYSLVPVDYQPDFGDVSLVPVDHDPFADEGGVTQLAQAQPGQPQQPQPAQPQPAPLTQPLQPQPMQTQPLQSQPTGSPQTPSAGVSQPNVPTPSDGGAPAVGEPNHQGSARGASASGQPHDLSGWRAYLPDRCGENPGHCGVGQAIGAVGDGAYSSLEGTGNALRFVGRSIGAYGPNEIKRSDQEIRAATEALKDGGRLLMESPEARSIAAHAALEAAASYWRDERNLYFLLGRGAFGIMTGLGPVAVIGDSTRALETGHNAMDALGKGIIGNREP